MTKEEKREYDKKYRAANKAKIAAYQKKWVEANREHKTAYDKAWNAKNKEKAAALRRAWKATKKHKAVVYYLPEHHYVGVTECLYNRLSSHTHEFNRFTEGYEIIYTAKDITEARAVERYMHYEMGYNGKKGGTKGY